MSPWIQIVSAISLKELRAGYPNNTPTGERVLISVVD
jgi:hypothetical protein